jgi:hypothetical protein
LGHRADALRCYKCDAIQERKVQSWGAAARKIRPGDAVWFSPGEKHWHGAGPSTAMTDISIVEQADGKSADWMEQVSDEQYQDAASAE